MTKWEYQIIDSHDVRVTGMGDLEERLNAAGAEGWELVGFTRYPFEERSIRFARTRWAEK